MRLLSLACVTLLACIAVSSSDADQPPTVLGDPTPANASAYAQLAVEAVREIDGAVLDYEPESLKDIDRLVLSFRSKGYTFEQSQKTLFTFGCYVGEVAVRHLGAKWVLPNEKTSAALGSNMMIQTKNGLVSNPIGKVGKLFENGEEDSVVFFYQVLKEHANKPLQASAPPNRAPPER